MFTLPKKCRKNQKYGGNMTRHLLLIIFTIFLVLMPFGNAGFVQASTPECQLEPPWLVKFVKERIGSVGSDAQFETHLIKGGRIVPLYVRGATKNLFYSVVAARGTPDDHKQLTNTQTLTGRKAGPEFNKVTITGIDLQGIETPELTDDRTVLHLQIPELGLFWPAVTFYVTACPKTGNPIVDAGGNQQGFVALAQARVSSVLLAQVLSLGVALMVYVLAAVGVWRVSTPPTAFRKVLNPFRLTAGVFGQSSVSNLQIFVFTLIVLGLLVHVLLRTGELSDISGNVAWLLGVVGVGTGAARASAMRRQQIEPAHLNWILKRGWVKRQPSISQLVTQAGEFSVTRFQSIAFSIVVAIALLIGGPSEISTFTIPESILGLLVASQAIYVGGKWVQPSTVDKDHLKAINNAIKEARAAEDELIRQIPPGTPEGKLKDEAMQQTAFQDYKEKAGKAANLIATYFEIKMPEKGLFGIPLS
jgi:hypothetical protein